MPRDIEQMQLFMALSLYIHSITANPPYLVPATPEMLFGTEFDEEQDTESEYEYEYDSEDRAEKLEGNQMAEVASVREHPPATWIMENRILDLGDDHDGSPERSPSLPFVEPV